MVHLCRRPISFESRPRPALPAGRHVSLPTMPLSPRADRPTIPAPYVFTPSSSFDGNDGSWSTFVVNIGDDGTGTTGQNFKVLVSTSSPVTMVPMQADWCTLPDQDTCAANRGVEPFQSRQTRGFQSASSKAWQASGVYSLPLALDVDYTPESKPNGSWGTDTVGLGLASPASLLMSQQLVVETTTQDYFMGSLGLASLPVDLGSGPIATFLANFHYFNNTPSLSYGYTAGASYRESSPALSRPTRFVHARLSCASARRP